ncbi:MAG: arsenate reductase [Rhodoferax sp.]|nr:arsenate reductase [Rhodoferax sp.]
MITVYGIPNCDSVKQARTWLAAHAVEYVFHDFKKQGVPPDRLSEWIGLVGLDRLVNHKGLTWRKLDPKDQADMAHPATAARVMQSHSSVIKRPVVLWNDGKVSLGFSPETFAERLKPGQSV